MIISKFVKVIIRNQGKYYASLGYPITKQGTVLEVPIEHLPLQSNLMIDCNCDKCGNKFSRQYQLLNKPSKLYGLKHFCNSCKRKFVSLYSDYSKNAKRMSSIRGSDHHNYNPNKKAYKAYQYKVQRITEQTYAENIDTINPYKYPRTICGVEGGYQLDHKVSIYKGFTFGINPTVIGSKDNLQMLPWQDNLAKST